MLGKFLRPLLAKQGYIFETELPCFLQNKALKLQPTQDMALALLGILIKEPLVLQVGANDGNRFDTLRPYLDNSLWNGFLVEGDPLLYQQLQVNNLQRKPRIQTLNLVIGSGEPAWFYSPKPDRITELPDWATGIGGFDSSHIEKHSIHFPGLSDYFRKQKVETITVNQLINNYLNRCPDLFFMDLEGYDGKVIEALDFNSYQPKVIIFESAHLPRRHVNDLFSRLGSFGYLVHWGPGDSIAIHSAMLNGSSSRL